MIKQLISLRVSQACLDVVKKKAEELSYKMNGKQISIALMFEEAVARAFPKEYRQADLDIMKKELSEAKEMLEEKKTTKRAMTPLDYITDRR